MDKESRNKPDISEKWCLADLNLNERSIMISVSESLEEAPVLQEQCGSTNNNNITVSHTDPKGDTPDNDCNSCESYSLLEDNISFTPKSEDVNLGNKSFEYDDDDDDDDDSIEILSMDGSCKDADIENIETSKISFASNEMGHISDCNEEFKDFLSNSSTSVINRKSRRKYSDTFDNRTISDSTLIGYKCENMDSTEKRRNSDMRMQLYTPPDSFVNKNFANQNNVSNTSCWLLVVLFLGLMCMSVGYYVGYQDSKKTANDLMGNLKKLQLENFMLKSRVTHLNKVYTDRIINLKLEKLDKEVNADGCKENRASQSHRGPEENHVPSLDLNYIFPDAWLLELQNTIMRNQCVPIENIEVLIKLISSLHETLGILKSNTGENIQIKNLEESKTKISKILNKIIIKLKKLSSYKENWMFMRAELRKELRGKNKAMTNWQFQRAWARQNERSKKYFTKNR